MISGRCYACGGTLGTADTDGLCLNCKAREPKILDVAPPPPKETQRLILEELRHISGQLANVVLFMRMKK